MLYNKTKNKKIVDKVIVCKSVISKAFGLMFRKKLKNKALLFVFNKEKRVSLHMLFVFQTIDALFLDKNKKVVEIKQLKPFQFYTSKKKAKYVLEMAVGEGKVEEGDEVGV